MVARLRERGYRMTPQRLAVLRVLARSEGHPSAEQIYQQLQPEYPMLSLATVYKTLETLKEIGEVLELEFRDGSNRYDGATPRPHPHLVCTGCGRIEDLDVRDLDTLALEISRRTGYAVLRHRLDFYGLCPACQSRSAGWTMN